MPKKYIFYLIGLLLLAGLFYYGYSKWTEASEKVDLWTLVPEDAVFVIESGNYEGLTKRLKQTQVWESLSGVSYLQRLEENMALLDSIGGSRQDLYKFLRGKTILTSVHVTSKTNFELIYYLPVSTVKEHRFIRTLGENLNQSNSFTQSTRTYENVLITDLENKTTGAVFSHFTYRNNLILSASPELLEEIIRKIKYTRFESPAAEFANIDYLNQEKVYANVFINYHNLPPFLNLFFKKELRPDIEYLSGLCRNSMLEFKLENNKIFMNGFSNPETLSQSFYRHLGQQKPTPLTIQDLLPNRTAVLIYLGIDQPWKLKQYTSPTKKAPPAANILLTDSLARSFSGPMALAYLQTNHPSVSPDKVIYARAAKPKYVSGLLQRIAAKTTASGKSQRFLTRYGKHTLGFVPVTELPKTLFGNLFSGYENLHYVQNGDYFLFADNLASLRGVLADIDAESVWGKSVAQKAFLEETQHETTVGIFVNSVNAWDILSRYLVENKKESLLRHENLIKDFNQFSIQYSQVDKQFYTTILLRQQDALAIEDQRTDMLEVEQSVSFPSKLIAGPFPVQNGLNKTREVLVQDSAFVFYKVKSDGKIAWSDSIGEKVKGPVVQSDLGSAGKINYLFTTSTSIHNVNQEGKSAENYPYYLPDTLKAQRLTVLDWKNNGNYRLLVDDELGNLYMFDETGSHLPGWNPRHLNARLAAPPQLYRIGDKNVLLVLLENGYVYALNENGGAYPGFPFSVKASLRSAAFGKEGNSLRNSVFTLVTMRGEVVTFNLTGQVTNRHQLVRPERNATFELIPENNGKTYLIARQSLGRVTLLNPTFKLLLERNFITSSRKIVQYYIFGGKTVYVITETGPGKTYLFDGKAKPIGNQVIENRSAVILYYNYLTNEYQLYRIFGNNLAKIALKH